MRLFAQRNGCTILPSQMKRFSKKGFAWKIAKINTLLQPRTGPAFPVQFPSGEIDSNNSKFLSHVSADLSIMLCCWCYVFVCCFVHCPPETDGARIFIQLRHYWIWDQCFSLPPSPTGIRSGRIAVTHFSDASFTFSHFFDINAQGDECVCVCV